TKGTYTEDDLMNVILDAGADDMTDEDDFFEVTASLENFETVRKAIEASSLNGAKIESASLQYVPKQTTKVEGGAAESTIKLISVIEDNDDVQNVYSNADIDEKVMEEFG
nr:YebC/PmpR family DNA-binding transcriptional regulator [Ignavibacteria bacterium]